LAWSSHGSEIERSAVRKWSLRSAQATLPAQTIRKGGTLKRFFFLVAALALVGVACAQQQNYPNRPVRIIIPWPPGQATDLAGRVVAL
jgi:hypothetical protein